MCSLVLKKPSGSKNSANKGDNMVIIISGASHTGKTLLAQNTMEKYNFPYLSIDHLKMGLIRSGQTSLTPTDSDVDLTNYLWPITREIIKTAIENNQNLIVEGCYVPCTFQNDFEAEYLSQIRHIFLVMSENYIRENFFQIKKYANAIEKRIADDDLSAEELIADNKRFFNECVENNLNFKLIENEYEIEFQI